MPADDPIATPETLEAEAARLRAEAEAFARPRLMRADLLERFAKELRKQAQGVQLDSGVTRKEHGRQMGRARRRNAHSAVYRWLDEHGMTMEQLAKACQSAGYKVSESALKAAARGAMGPRPYPAPALLRRAVQKVTKGAVGDDAWPLHAE